MCNALSNLIWILTLLFWAAVPVFAQEETLIPVFVYSPVPSDDQAIHLRQELFDGVRVNLTENGYELVILDDVSTQDDEQPTIYIQVFYDSYPDDDLYIEVRRSPLRHISLILEESPFYFSREPLDTAGQMITGVLLYSEEECELAGIYWDQAWRNLGTGFDDEDVVRLKANCELITRDYGGAIEIYEGMGESAHIDPESFNYAWALYQVGEVEAALEMADFLVLMRESDKASAVHSLLQRSRLLVMASRLPDAIADLDAAIEIGLDPFYRNYGPFTVTDLAAIYVERGKLYSQLQEPNRAFEDFNMALNLDSAYAPAYFYRGILYCGEGSYEAALQEFHQYLTISPDGEYADEALHFLRSLETSHDYDCLNEHHGLFKVALLVD